MESFSILTYGVVLIIVGLGLYFWFKRPVFMKIITVVDGDTYIALNKKGKKIKIRLKGVDCPEIGQKGGLNAKTFCEKKVLKKWVKVLRFGSDRYGRCVAEIKFGNSLRRDLGDELVQAGLAYPLKNASYKQRILYTAAMLTRKGVHRDIFKMKPWNWRK